MDLQLIKRPAVNIFPARGQSFLTLSNAPRRHQSSYRRTKQRLNIKPDSSFLLDNKSPKQNHIIFNPPAAVPSVFHTPLKFLPKEDKRRQLIADTLKPVSKYLPPLARSKLTVPHHHLSDTDIADIQRLRREEPNAWTNQKLARKFNCSTMFISICLSQCGGDDTVWRKQEKARLDSIKERWGPRRKMAHEDKLARMEIARRDG